MVLIDNWAHNDFGLRIYVKKSRNEKHTALYIWDIKGVEGVHRHQRFRSTSTAAAVPVKQQNQRSSSSSSAEAAPEY